MTSVNDDNISFFGEKNKILARLHEKYDKLDKALDLKYKKKYKLCSIYIYRGKEKDEWKVSLKFRTNRGYNKFLNSNQCEELKKLIINEVEKQDLGNKEQIKLELFLNSQEQEKKEKKTYKPKKWTQEEIDELTRNTEKPNKDYKNIEIVCKNTEKLLKEIPAFHRLHIIPSEKSFGVYIFFNTNEDVEARKKDGSIPYIVDFVYDELEKAGRGKRDEIEVFFEFDSYERVRKYYQGNYYLRLR